MNEEKVGNKDNKDKASEYWILAPLQGFLQQFRPYFMRPGPGIR